VHVLASAALTKYTDPESPELPREAAARREAEIEGDPSDREITLAELFGAETRSQVHEVAMRRDTVARLEEVRETELAEPCCTGELVERMRLLRQRVHELDRPLETGVLAIGAKRSRLDVGAASQERPDDVLSEALHQHRRWLFRDQLPLEGFAD